MVCPSSLVLKVLLINKIINNYLKNNSNIEIELVFNSFNCIRNKKKFC